MTGFGLLGHVDEMARGAGLTARLRAGAVPVVPKALELAREGIIPAGAYRNRDFLAGRVTVSGAVPLELADAFYDPQTAGGLVIAVPERRLNGLLERLTDQGLTAAVIGQMERKGAFSVSVE